VKTLFALLAAAIYVSSAAALAQTPVASVPSVDLARYSGKWFEIASFPMFFQRNCVADATAEYAAAADGALSVQNRCRTESGFDEATGRGHGGRGLWQQPPQGVILLALQVRLLGAGAGPRTTVGPWWANPNRKYLWVLSRTPQLPPKLMEAALASASAQGFDLTQLRTTAQAANRFDGETMMKAFSGLLPRQRGAVLRMWFQ
jgi:apolipoprotein D and lipocalin family protein